MLPVWRVAIAAGFMLAINMGIRQTFGLYLKPISQDLNLDRQVFSLAIALLNLIWGATAPLAGALSDKLGPIRVALGGAVCYIAGLVLMAMASGGPQLIWAGALIGLGVSGTGFTAVFGVIARAATPQNRASALSLATMGSAIGQFVALPYAHVLLDAQGRVASLLVMAATAALMLPLALTLGTGQGMEEPRAAAGQTLREALSEALATPSFLLLTAGFFVCGFQLAAVAVHLPAFLADKGFDPGLGAMALMVVGAGNIAGTWLCGRAGEIMPKRIALTLLYLGRGAIFLSLLALPLGEITVLLDALILGVLWLGTIPLTTGLIVTFFGPRWLSTLYGIVFFAHQIGSFLGAWLGGWFYDRTHSYNPLWWVAIMLSLAAALLHMPIRERPAPRLALRPAE